MGITIHTTSVAIVSGRNNQVSESVLNEPSVRRISTSVSGVCSVVTMHIVGLEHDTQRCQCLTEAGNHYISDNSPSGM